MVHFVGAGCGAPDLLTLRAKKYISEADTIIYAGSLVNPALLLYAREDCTILDSAFMTLEEVLSAMEQADAEGKEIVRLHTGEPSLYGAIREQTDALAAKQIPFDITPGVSAFAGAAASIGAEYTLPGVSQTLIITRMEGRTAMPEGERLCALAAHGASMAIYLSAGLVGAVQEELLRGAYTEDTPAAVVYKATWEDEKCVLCTVGTLAKAAGENGITKTAVILVGDFLGKSYEKSRLYAADFSTEYRKAGLQYVNDGATGTFCITFTDEGERLAKRLREQYPCRLIRCPRDGALSDWTAKGFREGRTLLFIGAAGIATRAIAPYIRHKATDPAVIVVDCGGRFVIPLLSGHLGGANGKARRIADVLGAEAVITTATDGKGVFAVDEWAKRQELAVANPDQIKTVSAALLRGDEVIFKTALPVAGTIPEGIRMATCESGTSETAPEAASSEPEAPEAAPEAAPAEPAVPEAAASIFPPAIVLAESASEAAAARERGALVLIPRVFAVGIGCRRGILEGQIREAIEALLLQNDIPPEAVFALASIDKKADEPGILAFCRKSGVPFVTFSAEELKRQQGSFFHSDFVEAAVGVDNVCERAAAAACPDAGRLVCSRRTADGITLAIAKKEAKLRFYTHERN